MMTPLHHVNNPRPVSTLLGLISGCKKHSITHMLKKQICRWVQKIYAIQNNMKQQYLHYGGHIQGHTHMTWTTSHIGKPANLFF